jgi:hypothetical protein
MELKSKKTEQILYVFHKTMPFFPESSKTSRPKRAGGRFLEKPRRVCLQGMRRIHKAAKLPAAAQLRPQAQER